jgi:hypothetical protein
MIGYREPRRPSGSAPAKEKWLAQEATLPAIDLRDTGISVQPNCPKLQGK